MGRRKKVFSIICVIVPMALAAFLIIRFVPVWTADTSWIGELGYRNDESYPLTFHGKGKRSDPEIPIEIAGESFAFMFDTGCGSGLAVTTRMEDRFDYATLGRREQLNRDGSHRGWSTHISIDSIDVCGETFSDIETNMIDWQMTSSSPYEGLIGLAYFQDRTVTLDYRSRRAAVSDRPIDYAALGPDYIVVPLLQSSEPGQRYLPFFMAEYEGQPVCVYLDTGKNHSYLHDPEGPSMAEKPDPRHEAVIAVGDMELVLRDIARADLAQAAGLPYPTMIELNSDQIWAHDLIVTFDLIEENIVFKKR